MSFLIDTNVASEIRKGRNANSRVRAWWEKTPEEDLYLSVMVIGEIRIGIEKLRSRDAKRADALEQWLIFLAHQFENRVLVIDQKIAEVWGAMSVKRSLPLADSLLAATAVTYQMTLVTRNTKDIQGTGVRYLNPFEI